MTVANTNNSTHSHGPGHDHNHCFETAMSTAEKICDESGARLTDTRRRVLELIWQGHSAVKAYDLIQQFADDGTTKPPTVYRALDFLLELGLIHRIESLNAFVGCADPGHHDSCGLQLMVCEICQRVEELHTHGSMTDIVDEAEKTGFKVKQPVLELHGICSECAS
jgi:Fur family zinc uptake transcriptional regulator